MTVSSPRLRLTKRIVDSLTPQARDRVIFDAELPGFGLKVTPRGTKVFLVQYRYPPGRSGRVRRYTIGTYSQGLTPDQARTVAIQVKGIIAAGRDPVAEREASHSANRRNAQRQQAAGLLTVDAVAAEFIKRHAKPRLRSWRDYERMLQLHVLPAWAETPIAAIRRSDVTKLLDKIESERSAALADHVLAIVRKLFNWHAARDDDFASPLVRGMARTSTTARARDRILADSELRALWRVLEQTPYPFGPFVRLLLLTAQRRDEVAHMRWSEIEANLWVIPKERYKTGRNNAVPLTSEALRVLKGLERSSDFVFTTTGHSPISGFSKAKRMIDEASDVRNWRLHDLRRTARSLMSRSGVASEIAERVLGHSIPGVAGVYDRHDYIDEKRTALQLISELVTEIARTAPDDSWRS